VFTCNLFRAIGNRKKKKNVMILNFEICKTKVTVIVTTMHIIELCSEKHPTMFEYRFVGQFSHTSKHEYFNASHERGI